jgi:uncharacterized protein (TIGR03663 family)
MSCTDMAAGQSTKSEASTTDADSDNGRLVIGGFRVPRTSTIVVLLLAAALALRLWELGDRPLHHDESLDAWWSWRFRNGLYTGYDPVYHGPLRFYITAGFYEVFGETDAVARLFSALSGTAVVGLPWFLRRELGPAGTIAAAVALTVSPTMIYYSRFGREDVQMVFLTLLAMVLGLSYLRTPRISTATGLAFSLACSFAIKESTYLFGLLLAVFLLIVLAAQFDAQNRVALGTETDPDKLNPAFISATLLFASAGLTVAAVVGHQSGELFPLIGLYMAALAAFVLATALPRLRNAHIRWSIDAAGFCALGAMLMATCLFAIRRGLGTASAPAWLIVTLLWAVAAVGLVLFVSKLPRTTASSGFEWPALVKAVGAIGWTGWSIALGTFAISWLLFFTVWLREPGDWATGFTRAIEYWDSQQEVNRGGQPWSYYLYALPIYEWFFVVLAVIGGWRGLRKPTIMSVLMVWFAVGSLILYSYAGERMPWLIAHPLLPILILAALGVQHLWQYRDLAAMSAIAAILGLALLFTTGTSIRASFPNGADSREILSQAGQATTHLTSALDRLDTIDDIAMRETGQPARVAIGSANAWPYSWYLRDRANLTWFDSCMGPPTDGSADVIIIDRTLTCTQDNTSQEIRPQEGFLDYQSTLFAMRSWWVPTYNDAGPLGWIRYALDRSLWEQNPNPGFVGVGEVAEDADGGIGATLDRLKDGADASADSFIGFVGADGERVPDPFDPGRFVETDDGRDGCGSVDQWFLVHNRFAFSERVVAPAPINAMTPLPCVSDLLSAN